MTVTTSWEAQLLSDLGMPVTSSNETFLYNWQQREGGGGANNPLNTTLRVPGSTSLSGNSAGVQNYPSQSVGLAATAQTIEGGYYPSIVGALRSGNAEAVNQSGGLSSNLLKWSGGGYSHVGAAPYTGGKLMTSTPAQLTSSTRHVSQKSSSSITLLHGPLGQNFSMSTSVIVRMVLLIVGLLLVYAGVRAFANPKSGNPIQVISSGVKGARGKVKTTVKAAA